MGSAQRNSVFANSKTLSVMLTYACTASCTNCGTSSHPLDKNRLDLGAALSGIDQAKALNFSNVVFTGGEPTLRWPDLLVAIRHANDLGLPTRLVTNAHWATSATRASALIEELVQSGLDEINFSTGDQHVRFVPIDRIAFATVAAIRSKMAVHVMIELTAERKISRNDVLGHPLILELPEDERRYIVATESPWMPLDPYDVESYPEGIAINSANLAKSLGCDSVLQTYVLQADGRIGSCCGLGMRHVPELSVGVAEGTSFLSDAITAAEEDFLKIWLRYKGAEKILAWAAQHDPEIVWENKYAHCCQACMRIYRDPRIQKVIREHYEEIVPEVIQLAWLNDHYIPDKLSAAADR
jgi:organic radical activating enzyme